MAKILSEATCTQINTLRRKFNKFADMGWMCEGTDDADGNLYNLFFNNDTDECFKADYAGNIVDSDCHSITDAEMAEMAKIQGRISRLAQMG